MRKEMFEIMACPVCKGNSLQLETLKAHEDVIFEGRIICLSCGKQYAITKGIPNMLPVELRSSSNSLQKTNIKEDEHKHCHWVEWRKQQVEFMKWQKKDTKAKLKRKKEAAVRSEGMWGDLLNFLQLTNGRLLDIGCGGEWGRLHLEYHGFHSIEYFGIDPSSELVSSEFPFAQSVGEYIPFREETFDYVMILATLDHVTSPVSVLKESWRVLKKSGRILVSSMIDKRQDSSQNVIFRLRQKIASEGFKELIWALFTRVFSPKEGHLHHFDSQELINLIQELFANVKSTYIENGIALLVKGEK